MTKSRQRGPISLTGVRAPLPAHQGEEEEEEEEEEYIGKKL